MPQSLAHEADDDNGERNPKRSYGEGKPDYQAARRCGPVSRNRMRGAGECLGTRAPYGWLWEVVSMCDAHCCSLPLTKWILRYLPL